MSHACICRYVCNVCAMLMLLMCVSGSHVLQKLSCAYFILPVDQRVFLVGICDSPKTGKHSKAQSFLNGEWCARGRTSVWLFYCSLS